MRRWLITIGIVVLLGATLAFTVLDDGDGDFEILTAAVESGPITMTIETSGTGVQNSSGFNR